MGSLNRQAAAVLLRDPETYMVSLFSILLRAYGDDVLSWDPLEIYAAVEEDFQSEMPIQLENRLNAGLTCISNDAFYTDIRVFKAVCNALYSGDVGDDLILDPVTLVEIIWAVFEMELLRGSEDEPEFSPGIMNFIRQTAAEEAVDVDTQEDLDGLRNRFIEESIADLGNQLESIGIDATSIYA